METAADREFNKQWMEDVEKAAREIEKDEVIEKLEKFIDTFKQLQQ